MSTAEVIEEDDNSAFLPGTNIQVAWDATSLGWFKRCPQLYKYKMIDGWVSQEESVNLRFGIEYHKALQNYEKQRASGLDHEESLFYAVRDTMFCVAGWKSGHQYKNPYNLLRTIVWYCDKYKDDLAETYIMSNGNAAVEVSFRFQIEHGPKDSDFNYILCGHLDRVVNFNGDLWVMDHKTTKNTPGEYFWNQFEPDNQMTLYSLAGEVVLNTPIKGVMISAAQVAVDFSRFVRGFTQRSKDQIEEWVNDLQVHLGNAQECAENNYWPHNDTACDKYGGCEFRRICSRSPSVREQWLKADFKKGERWNPLAIR